MYVILENITYRNHFHHHQKAHNTYNTCAEGLHVSAFHHICNESEIERSWLVSGQRVRSTKKGWDQEVQEEVAGSSITQGPGGDIITGLEESKIRFKIPQAAEYCHQKWYICCIHGMLSGMLTVVDKLQSSWSAETCYELQHSSPCVL